MTEYLSAVENLIRELNLTANDIEAQETKKQEILLKVQSLAHCKYGEDSYNCSILVQEAQELLKYYGYGNELANQNFQEPESPHVYDEPESPGIKVDEYE